MDEQNPGRYPGEEHYYIPGGKIIPPPAERKRGLVKIMAVLLAVLLIMVAALTMAVIHLARQPISISPAPATAGASIPTAQPTSQLMETPTTQLTPTATEPVSTPTALAGPETLQENIRLNCDCSDPVVVTITKIVIQPPQNRMLWSLTLYNNSQSDDGGAFFNQFSLQEGDQITNPAGSGEQTFNPTGPGVTDNLPDFPGGTTQQIVITFSFVPYTGTPYTLTSELDGISGLEGITFDPAVIQF